MDKRLLALVLCLMTVIIYAVGIKVVLPDYLKKRSTKTVKRVVAAYVNGEEIPAGDDKAKEILEAVKKIISENIKDGMTDYQKELAFHDYIVKTCTYSANPDQPYQSDIHHAYGCLVNHDAVCDGYAEALQILFDCVGIESYFMTGVASDLVTGTGENHAWNLVKIDGKWYHLDATWDDPEVEGANYAPVHWYFNLSDADTERDHSWDREDYPAAVSSDASFYKNSKSYFKSVGDMRHGMTAMMKGKNVYQCECAVEGPTPSEEDLKFMFGAAGKRRYFIISQEYKDFTVVVLRFP